MQPTTQSVVPPAFLAPVPFFRCRQTIPTCRRRQPPKRLHRQPTMLAKYTQKENTEQPESETPLESLVPPPALPTLSTLSGSPSAPSDADSQQGDPSEVDLSQINTLGTGLSAEEENSIFTFLKGVAEEFGKVDWPSAARVVRLTVIVILTIVFAVVGLYFVDGFFYRMASILFEGKV